MNGRRWTETENGQLRTHASKGAAALAKILRRSEAAINSQASKLGIPLGRCAAESRVTELVGFMKRVEFDPFGGCWLWSAHHQQTGYGTTVRNRRHVMAHRLSWELHHGPIPEDLIVCHRCDVRACVNPDHLFLGTHQDNNDDMIAKRRNAFGERNPNAVIDAETAREVKALLAAGIGPTEAARRVGISRQIARNIAYADSWRCA